MASSFLNQAARRGVARGIDFHLAEKVVGAGFNSRRSVNIEWTGVDKLTAWRFGMATATAVEIPENLWEGVDRHVRSEEHTSELQSLMRISYAVFCLTKQKKCNIYTS